MAPPRVPGRRLILRYDTDRAGVRAVVLHELAHLRNRDVGKTYLTIAIWWAFVATALLPFVALVVHPALFYTPLRWSLRRFDGHWAQVGYQVGSVLVLTAVVYLTRNAILRTRETHADELREAGVAVLGPNSASERTWLRPISSIRSSRS